MSEPYRDQGFSDNTDFVQHIGIAEHLLETLEDMAREFASFYEFARRADALGIDQRAEAAKASWDGAWAQLDEASAIVRGRGRSLQRFHVARQSARAVLWPLVLSFGEWRVGRDGRRWRLVKGRLASLLPMKEAIAALRAELPEVVVPRAKCEPVPDLRRRVAWFWPAAGALIALMLWQCT